MQTQDKSTEHEYSYELPRERVRFIAEELNMLMADKMPFLQRDYSMRQLAKDTHIPSYQLSAFINRIVGLNFNEYMNRFRVRYCEDLIHKMQADDLNMKGLALTCGFHNRNSFTAAFKKFTGFTPSEYRKFWKL